MDEKMSSRKALPSICADPKSVSPARLQTDSPVVEKHHRDPSNLHKRLHSSSLRRRAFTSSREHGYRKAAKDTVQSAIELKPPLSFDTLLRRDKKSPDQSRRVGTSHHNPQHPREVSDHTAQQTQRATGPKVRPEDVEKAKRDNAKREQELRDSFKRVEEVAMSSTRKLDDTYYAILEKASLLRNTVASLHQLTEESRRMHAAFKLATGELEKETDTNLESFGNFDQQEQTINGLVTRLSSAKERTNTLKERLEAARTRVAEFEQREKEKQKARRLRYSAMWATLAAVLVLIIAVVVGKKRNAVGSRLYSFAKLLDELGHEVAAMTKPSPATTSDSYLEKLFDEL